MVDTASPTRGDLTQVARGGALNLVGAVTYGAANFILILIVTNKLGAAGVGQFLIGLAVFNIGVKVAELGAATGFVRMISRSLVLDRAGEIPTLVVVGLAPVAVVGVILAVILWIVAPDVAPVFGESSTPEVTRYLRTLAPFLPLAAIYSVVVQGTRGFGTMRAQTFVEKIGKAVAQPLAAFVVLTNGAGETGLALAWVVPAALATIPAAVWFHALAGRAMEGSPAPTSDARAVAGEFWRFAAPRALSQLFQVTVLWFDILLIGALLGTSEAGIYAAATRFLMVGNFVAEAIMQVVGPRISGLVSAGEIGRARQVFQSATGWQVLLIWPPFVLIGVFGAVLLQLFGDGFAVASTALAILAGAMVFSSLFGPSDTVILMAGRSSLSLFNTAVSVTLNIGGNLLLTPRFGLIGAAVAWSLSILTVSVVPAYQGWRHLRLHPFGTATCTAAVVAAAAVGVPAILARWVLGPEIEGLVAAAVVGGGAFAAAAWTLRDRIGLVELGQAFRPGR